MLGGALGSTYAVAETTVKAIPLMLAALGVSLAFQDEAVEYRGGRTALYGRFGRQRDSAQPAPSGPFMVVVLDAAGRFPGRWNLGFISRSYAGLVAGKRNFDHTNA